MVHTDNGKEGFSRRLRQAMTLQGWPEHGSQARLAKLTKTTAKAANKWVNGESMPRRDKLEVMARALNVRLQWLEYGEGQMSAAPSHGVAEDSADYGIGNVELAHEPPTQRVAPVISRVQAGEWSEAIDIYAPGYAERWEPVPENACPYAFWLVVKGDSMTAPAGLSIPEGYLILVEPSVPAENGSLVVAKLVDENEVTFKKLVIDGPNKYLKPLNPEYRTIQINGNCRLVGTVTEVKMKLR